MSTLPGYPKSIKSVKIAIVKSSNGTHATGNVFGGDFTYFSIKVSSGGAAHYATVKVKWKETQVTPDEFRIYAGDSLAGPFAEVEIDALSNSAMSAFIYYQEH